MKPNQKTRKTSLTSLALVPAMILLLIFSYSSQVNAQNVGINTDTPDASAMLDVTATDAGILIPRLTLVQRDAITSPATGLLIFQTDNDPGYYYNAGTPVAPDWVKLIIPADVEGEWTDDGTYLYPNEDTCPRVYEEDPDYGFYYIGPAANPGFFVNNVLDTDYSGVYGQCANSDYFGFGGYFVGGYTGAMGTVTATGAESYNGLMGSVDGGTGSNVGVMGTASGGANNYGLMGTVNDAVGFGAHASNTNASGTGLLAVGNNLDGAYLTGGSGVAGKGSDVGVYGTATAAEGSGVYGSVDIADGFGVEARNANAAGTGLLAAGNNATAQFLTNGTGAAFTGEDGALSFANTATGTGLIGVGNNVTSITTLTNGSGVCGLSDNAGVYGLGTSAAGSNGVYGESEATDGAGVFGINSQLNSNATGVYAQVGDGTAATVDPTAVFGYSNVTDDIYGYGGYFSAEWNGIYAENRTTTSGYAGYFSGDINATGDVAGATKSFLIDNPENPENEVLRHTSIESDEAMVVYRGKVKLNQNGEAVVDLPSYFKALTKENEATVQITCIGRPFPIGYEWNSDFASFTAYGDAGEEVSWMVMADRDDPYIRKNRKPVVIPKDGNDKGYKNGYYIHPDAYDQPREKGYDYLWNHKDRTRPEAPEKEEKQEIQSFDDQRSKKRTEQQAPAHKPGEKQPESIK